MGHKQIVYPQDKRHQIHFEECLIVIGPGVVSPKLIEQFDGDIYHLSAALMSGFHGDHHCSYMALRSMHIPTAQFAEEAAASFAELLSDPDAQSALAGVRAITFSYWMHASITQQRQRPLFMEWALQKLCEPKGIVCPIPPFNETGRNKRLIIIDGVGCAVTRSTHQGIDGLYKGKCITLVPGEELSLDNFTKTATEVFRAILLERLASA